MANTTTGANFEDEDDDNKPSREARKIAKTPPPRPAKVPVAPIRIIWMTPKEWAKVPPNPFQKENRAKRTNIEHLRHYEEEHATVRMGVYPDGRRCKIDAHTRSDIWENRPWLVDVIPARLRVECYPVKDDAEAAARFQRVDNRKSSKNAADDVHGSFRLAGISTESTFFRNASNIKSALTYAYAIVMTNLLSELAPQERAARLKRSTINDHVRHFAGALDALDALHVNRSKLTAPFVTAFLVAYERHGVNIVPFFKRVNEGTHGIKNGKKMCPIHAVEHERGKHKGGGATAHMDLTAHVLGALEKYMEGDFKRADYRPNVDIERLTTVDIDQYLVRDKMRRTGRTRKDDGPTR